jgi:DNA helicase-2/ATP-dependent DNA helicase PcrA
VKLVPGIGNITAGKLWGLMSTSENPLDTIFEGSRLVPKKAQEGFRLFLDLIKILNGGPDQGKALQPSAAIDHILRKGYEDYLYNHYPNAEDRIEDIEQMTRFAHTYTSLEHFISELSLQSASGGEVEEREENKERLILSTVHQAKGLEWDIVFVIGLNDGRFPSSRSLKTDYEEEERRLFYVAVTRARDDLYLCYPMTSEEWHGLGFLKPSRFVKELPKDVYDEFLVEGVSDSIQDSY